MQFLPNILFSVILIAGIVFFIRNVKKIVRNIRLGRSEDRSDRAELRWKQMAKIALGQSKMGKRPVSALLHLIVYVGFIIINIELLEIVLDGIFGTHRLFSVFGGFYDFLIGSFEILALLVIVAVIAFWTRRMVLKIPRFWNKEMTAWPRKDALNILYFELVLMSLFLLMNAADFSLQLLGHPHYPQAGSFPVSKYALFLITRVCECPGFY